MSNLIVININSSACFGVINCASSTRTHETSENSCLTFLKIFSSLEKQKSVSRSGPMRVNNLVPFLESVSGLMTQTLWPRSS